MSNEELIKLVNKLQARIDELEEQVDDLQNTVDYDHELVYELASKAHLV